jgi:hypothetical protein
MEERDDCSAAEIRVVQPTLVPEIEDSLLATVGRTTTAAATGGAGGRAEQHVDIRFVDADLNADDPAGVSATVDLLVDPTGIRLPYWHLIVANPDGNHG